MKPNWAYFNKTDLKEYMTTKLNITTWKDGDPSQHRWHGQRRRNPVEKRIDCLRRIQQELQIPKGSESRQRRSFVWPGGA